MHEIGLRFLKLPRLCCRSVEGLFHKRSSKTSLPVWKAPAPKGLQRVKSPYASSHRFGAVHISIRRTDGRHRSRSIVWNGAPKNGTQLRCVEGDAVLSSTMTEIDTTVMRKSYLDFIALWLAGKAVTWWRQFTWRHDVIGCLVSDLDSVTRLLVHFSVLTAKGRKVAEVAGNNHEF